MKRILLVLFLAIGGIAGWAQVPAPSNDNCSDAIEIADARTFCGQFSSAGATEQFTGNGPEVWFSFVARNFEIKINVTGASGNGALQSPEVNLYVNCDGDGLPGRVVKEGNTTILERGALTPGKRYFISVSGSNTGQFSLCTTNYNPPVKAGQDFSSASLLCSVTDSVMELNLTGAGENAHESAGTCLGSESRSVWYRWTAANNGTLVFTITPTRIDDIDWILYDLGVEGQDFQLPSASTSIRCAAGHGIDNSGCPDVPRYVQTGLDFSDTEMTEQSGCGPPGSKQNGVVKYVDMIKGHVYALLVDNFSLGNNGFKLKFTDRQGKAGTGEFEGPVATLSALKNNECTPQQSYTFTATAARYTGLKWYFGEGASIDSADTPGPFTISYATPGLKTVVLQVSSDEGCAVVQSETFTVGSLPPKPVITSNKPDFCILDTIKLATSPVANGTYHWSGPNNFTSTEPQVNIPITDFSVSGTYRLTTEVFGCRSEETTVEIPPILKNPTAAFSTSPRIVSKFTTPLKVTFKNESVDATSFLWDFGDGNTSTEVNPVHEYTTGGDFDISLTAFKSNVCQATVVHGTFVIKDGITLFIPNTFTPNNDGVNDEFVVTLTNLNSYHIRIFNRWGDQLFESADIFNNWDGIYKGEPVPVGTYFYLIDALDANNGELKKSGSVTVLR